MGWFDGDKKKPSAHAATSTGPAPATPRQAAAKPPKPESRLGENVHIEGTVTADEPMVLHGSVDGMVRAHKDLMISPAARVKATVHGVRVRVEGTVNGDIRVSEALVLGVSASVTGNIETPSLQIEDGAFFKGTIEMKPAPKPAKQPATRPTKDPAPKPANVPVPDVKRAAVRAPEQPGKAAAKPAPKQSQAPVDARATETSGPAPTGEPADPSNAAAEGSR